MTNQDETTETRTAAEYRDMVDKAREQYNRGLITIEDAFHIAMDIAFETGINGEGEEFVTMMVYTSITGKFYNPDDWA